MVVERMKRKAVLGWVPIDMMRVREEISQRKFDQNWANTLARDFDIEKFGTPVVNRIADWFWIVDGQHRIAALRQWLEDPKGQKVECWVYHDLSEKDEAELFLSLSKVKGIGAFDKFTIALTARREDETNISAIVKKNHLKISRQHGLEGSIACVGTLAQVYRRGASCLDRDLKIVNNSFGDSGLEADIVGGIGLMVSRYDGALDDEKVIRALSSVRGGVNTLRSRAERLRQQTGNQKKHCIAAAAVEIHNRAKGGKKLAGWWKSDEGAGT